MLRSNVTELVNNLFGWTGMSTWWARPCGTCLDHNVLLIMVGACHEMKDYLSQNKSGSAWRVLSKFDFSDRPWSGLLDWEIQIKKELPPKSHIHSVLVGCFTEQLAWRCNPDGDVSLALMWRLSSRYFVVCGRMQLLQEWILSSTASLTCLGFF